MESMFPRLTRQHELVETDYLSERSWNELFALMKLMACTNWTEAKRREPLWIPNRFKFIRTIIRSVCSCLLLEQIGTGTLWRISAITKESKMNHWAWNETSQLVRGEKISAKQATQAYLWQSSYVKQYSWLCNVQSRSECNLSTFTANKGP